MMNDSYSTIIILRDRWITHMPCGYCAVGRRTSIGCCTTTESVSIVPCMLTNHSREELADLLKSPKKCLTTVNGVKSGYGHSRLINDQLIGTSYKYHRNKTPTTIGRDLSQSLPLEENPIGKTLFKSNGINCEDKRSENLEQVRGETFSLKP